MSAERFVVPVPARNRQGEPIVIRWVFQRREDALALAQRKKAQVLVQKARPESEQKEES